MTNNKMNCTCSNEKVYSKYIIEKTKNGTYIKPDTSSESKSYCPFDRTENLVSDYLYIGYLKTSGKDTDREVISFIKENGMPYRKSAKLKTDKFAEDAEMLYLHMCEVKTRPYPKSPEWVLEPSPVALVVDVIDNKTVIRWQTDSLAAAIELGYTMLLGDNPCKLTICKKCGKPFYARNPKREFCSLGCRNNYNVQKFRAKK